MSTFGTTWTPNPRIPPLWRFVLWLVSALIRLLFRVRVVGAENVPTGNYIAIGNHLNWVDPFLLLLALPREPCVYFIGAAQAMNRPWKRWLMPRVPFWVPVERGAQWVGKDAFVKPLRVLESGAVLALFPEGDSGPREGELMPLKPGIEHLALRTGVPILPIALSGVKELYLRKLVMVTIGKPFLLDNAGLDRRAALHTAHTQIGNELRAVLPAYVEPQPKVKLLKWLTNALG